MLAYFNRTLGSIFQWNLNRNSTILAATLQTFSSLFSWKKMDLKMFAKWRPFCLRLNVLNVHCHLRPNNNSMCLLRNGDCMKHEKVYSRLNLMLIRRKGTSKSRSPFDMTIAVEIDSCLWRRNIVYKHIFPDADNIIREFATYLDETWNRYKKPVILPTTFSSITLTS